MSEFNFTSFVSEENTYQRTHTHTQELAQSHILVVEEDSNPGVFLTLETQLLTAL